MNAMKIGLSAAAVLLACGGTASANTLSCNVAAIYFSGTGSCRIDGYWKTSDGVTHSATPEILSDVAQTVCQSDENSYSYKLSVQVNAKCQESMDVNPLPIDPIAPIAPLPGPVAPPR